MLARRCCKSEFLYVADSDANDTATLENSLQFLIKSAINLPCDLAISFLGI